MRESMERALRKSRAEYTEIRIERTFSSWMTFRGPELDNIGSSSSVGGIVRALVQGGWGMATFNDLGDLESRVEEAYDCARLVGAEKTLFAETEPSEDRIAVELERDFREVPLSDKQRVMEEYNTLILKHDDKIQTSSVTYRDKFSHIRYANSEGTYIEEERPDVTAYLVAIARDGDNVQRAAESVSGAKGFEIVEGLYEKAETAATRAVSLLSAPKVTGDRYTVVLDPKIAGVFAHEAFGHLSEADFVYENPKMKELMVLGKRFGPDFLNILDDGSIPNLRATHRYDDEGVPTRRNYLIREGILVGRLHSRETAAKMGESVTGNARAISYQHPPIVRMTNTYIDDGDVAFDEMISDVDLGLYARDWFGGQTMMEMFTFSAGYGYMIRNGEVAELVRDVVLTGNVFQTLMNVDRIGNDLTWTEVGGCGKGGQSPLAATMGSPHIRIRDVVVGGAR